MGLYERWELGSLLGFNIGMIFAVFHLLGIVLLLMIRLYSLVRRLMALVSRCFR